MWALSRQRKCCGRITLDGVVTEFTDGIEGPESIIAGCDGNLWFTDPFRGTIGRITPKGKITEFSAAVTNEPAAITTCPDGNLWFAEVDDEIGNGQIGRIGTGPLPKPHGRRDPTLPLRGRIWVGRPAGKTRV